MRSTGCVLVLKVHCCWACNVEFRRRRRGVRSSTPITSCTITTAGDNVAVQRHTSDPVRLADDFAFISDTVRIPLIHITTVGLSACTICCSVVSLYSSLSLS